MGVSMGLLQVGITATATMLAVMLGGWLTVRAQDRLWRRDQERQWRDIRLSAYREFVGAFREYVAFILRPDVQISAVPRPREPGDLMSFFDEIGTRYKERLELAKTALRLVAYSRRNAPDGVHFNWMFHGVRLDSHLAKTMRVNDEKRRLGNMRKGSRKNKLIG